MSVRPVAAGGCGGARLLTSRPQRCRCAGDGSRGRSPHQCSVASRWQHAAAGALHTAALLPSSARSAIFIVSNHQNDQAPAGRHLRKSKPMPLLTELGKCFVVVSINMSRRWRFCGARQNGRAGISSMDYAMSGVNPLRVENAYLFALKVCRPSSSGRQGFLSWRDIMSGPKATQGMFTGVKHPVYRQSGM